MIELRWPFVLASASPRRRELLQSLIPKFDVVAADVDEQALTVEDPWRTAELLALSKAEAVAALHPGALVIGGDTVVAITNAIAGFEQLAKPRDPSEATAMLERLSGASHLVVTGVALVSPAGTACFSDTTSVRFRDLQGEEISAYVASGEPMDKAGGYGIQGGAAAFVEHVEGSIENVIGLPIQKLEAALIEIARRV